MDREIEREGRWGQVRGGRGVGGWQSKKEPCKGGGMGRKRDLKGEFCLFCFVVMRPEIAQYTNYNMRDFAL